MANSADNRYTIIGAEESPYSVKVRSYIDYKAMPYRWLSRAQAPDLYQAHAKLPLVPLVITPDQQGLQDSTPIMDALEHIHPEPSVHPAEPTARFVSELLEEFADEWGNKWMFHYRWAREADQVACSRRLAALMSPGASGAALEQTANTIRTRMVDRVWFVGSSPQTAQQIEDSFKDMLQLLEAHLSDRTYLFGERPAYADFALWGQLYNCRRDPTPCDIIKRRAPFTDRWIDTMIEPRAQGDFEHWETLAPTLKPVIQDQVAGLFLPWSDANARAIARNDDVMRVELRGGTWEQRPQKYHARSLAVLRERYQRVADVAPLADFLKRCGAHEWLVAG